MVSYNGYIPIQLTGDRALLPQPKIVSAVMKTTNIKMDRSTSFLWFFNILHHCP
jgi:hypothetical protein